MKFTSQWQQARVVFGANAILQLPEELESIGLRRALIVTTPGRSTTADSLRELLADKLAGVFSSAAQHVPRDAVNAVLADVDRLSADSVIAIGGGSAVGLAKAIALNRSLPIVALPTTYAGSEMTSIYGVTERGEKRTGRDPRVAPRLVIYDPVLTLSLPGPESAASGMNAIAHGVEAMYAPDAGPIAAAAAAEAIRTLNRALPLIMVRPGDLDARSLALRGAHAAGVALELSAMGLHHKICHVLGGTFGLPHAPTHAAVLPHVVAFNAPAAAESMAQIAALLESPEAATGLRRLNETLGLQSSLGTLGLRTTDIPRAANLVAASSYPNPRPVSADDVRAILMSAL